MSCKLSYKAKVVPKNIWAVPVKHRISIVGISFIEAQYEASVTSLGTQRYSIINSINTK